MKFLVDAQLPKRLCWDLRKAGHEAIHTLDLKDGNRTSDAVISQKSVDERWVVITKDTDFYHRFILKEEPWKLVLVRTGNLGVVELCNLFERNGAALIHLLAVSDLVELDSQSVWARSNRSLSHGHLSRKRGIKVRRRRANSVRGD